MATGTRTTHLRTFWPKTSLSRDVKAASFEFVGTTMFLLLAFGGVQASHEVQGSALEQTLYIATSFGLSLLVSVWCFFRVTGGLFNPNVSLALLLAGYIGPMRFVFYCIAQLTGGIAAAAIVRALTAGPVAYKYVSLASLFPILRSILPQQRIVLTLISPVLAKNINLAQGVFIEMFITAALCLAVLMLAAEKHSSTPFAPVRICFPSSGDNFPPHSTKTHCPSSNTDRRRLDTLCLSFVRPIIFSIPALARYRAPQHGIAHLITSLTLTKFRFAVPYTGAGMNTARAFGPAAVLGFPNDSHWIVR
jgi:glycerol uptake facilitator-like aquaporin